MIMSRGEKTRQRMKSCPRLKVFESVMTANVSFSVSLSKSEDGTMKKKLEDGELEIEDLFCNEDGNEHLWDT